MEIKLYEDRYRDDMIFMVLQAKDALGRIPSINEDLLDIKKNYFDRGDMFWIAADDNDRVIGCGGYSRIEGTNEAFIHRLYIKASEKRKVRLCLKLLRRECAATALRQRGCISAIRRSSGLSPIHSIRSTGMPNTSRGI